MSRPRLATLSLSLVFALAACPGADSKKTEAKKADAKADTPPAQKHDPGTSLDKEVTAIDLAGPVPPETSAVLYTVDGALIPIGCFHKDRKKLGSGKDCSAIVKAGDEVYLKSNSTEQLDKLGGPKGPLCEPGGGGTPASWSVPAVDAGAPFDYAVFPKSLARQLHMMSEDTWNEKKPSLAAEDLAAITAIAKVEGELTIRQVALHDLDGDNAAEKIVSVFQINPKDSERFSYAGVLVARGSAPGTWFEVEGARNDTQNYTVRAAVDLDGDRHQELWINAVLTDGAGGDRVVRVTASGGDPLGKWSCGV
jgi:hypothetical protein